MKPLFFLLLLLAAASGSAQVPTTRLNSRTLPSSISCKDPLVYAARWSDKSGTHLLVATETGETPGNNGTDDARSASLLARHYLQRDSGYQLTWKVYDYVENCPVDLMASFNKEAFAITDLDNNGQAEVWLLYETTCRGDVSPNNMKIIMYEDTRKYAARGNTRVRYSETGYEGGEYRFDEAFRTGPAVFRQYAARLWKKHIRGARIPD